jgi:hypothetical protein
MAEKRFLVKNGLKVYAEAVIDDSLSVGGALTAATLSGQYLGFDSDFNISLGNITTDSVAEGNNLYYTTVRHDSDFDVRLATKTTGNLTEGSNLYYTTARADSAFDIRLATKTTSNLSEGSNLYYTTARADSAFDVRLATKTTTNISEGLNLYYTTARADSDFDVRLATKTTTNVAEGSNLYYTTARADSDFDVRLATKTTTNVAEGTNLYYTTARHDSDFDVRLATKTTTNVTEGTNLYYTTVRVDSDIDAAFAVKSTTDLSEGNNLYYTTVRADSDFDARLATKTTSNLTEGSNLYYTDARVNTVLTADPSISGVTFYGESSGGLSLNEDVNLGDSTTTVFNISAETSSKNIAYSLNIPSQVNATIGLTGTDASNDFVIGFEQANTEFKIKSGVGGSPIDLTGGTTLLTLGTTGILTLTSAQQSTNKTTGSIITAGGIGVDKDVRAENFIAVNNVTAGTNGTGKFIGNVTGTVSSFSNHTLDDIKEGDSNFYYTTTRFDSDLLNTSTTGLPEGNNLYYTTARADSDAKRAISVNNSGGFGTLSYVDSTGVISYQGPTTAEIRSQFTAGTGVTISSGQISIGQDVGLTDSVQFQSGAFTGDVIINGNLTVVGTQTVTTQNELRISNALLKVADSNYANTVDIGVVGSYSNDGTILRRAGFFRDATNGEWYAFNNLRQNGLDSSSPDQTINTADSSFELGTWNFKALRGSYLGFDSDFRVFSTNYTEYDSDFTAATAGRYALNTTGGGFTVTLPSSPTTGDYIKLIDIGNWTNNPVTVNRNGSTIEGYSDNFQLDLGQSIIEFIYINSTWQVYSSIGQRGPQGEKGDSAEVASFASGAQAIAYSIALG